ncbi:MAG TPA: wax ester/triacylglycerol synthase family O-acyltransferase [Blastocatellia bacterium]|nr:wax ester/triacylglycerol synthase family O-acyltransferase [Blastocatellia bacterium]
MQQLSGTDHLFLHQEKGNVYTHVAGIGIYDPSTAPGGAVSFQDIRRFFSARLHKAKAFRRRLVAPPPLSLDRPYWIEEAAIDLDFHIRRLVLSEPGDWPQLCAQVAALHSIPLDRSHPLWEVHVIEGIDSVAGVPPGSFALLMKFHHAAVDGEAGSELMRITHTLSPDEAVESPPPAAGEPSPNMLDLFARMFFNGTQRWIDTVNFSLNLGSKMLQSAPDVIAALAQKRAPRTRVDQPISSQRVFDAADLPLPALLAMRQRAPGVTINDLFLTVLGGALRRYLGAKNELPAESLMAAVPVSLREKQAARDADSGNAITTVAMPLHSEIADPLERLRAVVAGARQTKANTGALGKTLLADLVNVLIPQGAELLVSETILPAVNCTASNVRRPDVPLYLAGARMVRFYPLNILFNRLGLANTAFSCNGALSIGVVSCRRIMPDPDFYAQCLRESFEELGAALGITDSPATQPPQKSRTQARRATKAGTGTRTRQKPDRAS